MADYTISVNTAATASDSTEWVSDMERIEEASAAAHPLVWTEKKGGQWKRMGLLPDASALPVARPRHELNRQSQSPHSERIKQKERTSCPTSKANLPAA